MKLKKSLLIVPAMATLLFAAAGSVGGTVAWFSAVSTYKTDITSFKVVRLDGDLACALAEGVGTDVEGTGSTAQIKLEENAELTHGSFNHANKNVYVTTGAENSFVSKAVMSDTAPTPASGSLEAATYTLDSKTHTVYYAVTWSMAFTYTLPVSGASAGQATNLYLDLANSKFTAVAGGQSTSLLTQKGFRLAFFKNTNTTVTTNGNSDHYNRVWADLQTSEKCSYVSSTSATASYAAADKVLITSESATIPEGEKGTKDVNYCLGQFKVFSGSASKLGYTCVAWFEGSDENVKNAASMDEVTVNLAFYTRTSED